MIGQWRLIEIMDVLLDGVGYDGNSYFPSISGRCTHEADNNNIDFGSRATLYLKK